MQDAPAGLRKAPRRTTFWRGARAAKPPVEPFGQRGIDDAARFRQSVAGRIVSGIPAPEVLRSNQGALPA